MKKLSLILSLVLIVSMLAGCAGTPVVYYTNCTCPVENHTEAVTPQPEPTEGPVATGSAVKTGLAIITGVGESTSAAAEAEGVAKYDVTVVAVTVDENGVITGCVIDSIGSEIKFNTEGVVTSDLEAAVASKNELGENYGMKAYGGAQYEWNEQAAALAQFAVGKTVEELRSGAVDETGHAVDVDLASTATIYLGGYVNAIEAAVANAQSLGAQAGDELKYAVTANISGSADATAEKNGTAQLEVNVAAITMNGDVITSCVLDAVQAKVSFDVVGQITTDLTAAVATKNQLGENYGMKAWGGAIAEWNEQAASFASYITGNTLDEVAGIAVDEGTKPTDADLTASVTIAIGGFQGLIAKAAQ